ncbi:hypothetical protein [Dysgonomonas termitidis]|uniref:Uncharacterized protein n=1 Tax=Dysgonomonas termitidis TaxID=1516126 RepID=A0ABV9KU50_9BACT
MKKGILLDTGNDLLINVKHDSRGRITGGLVVGERQIQDAYIVLSVNKGEIKEDPVCGANLLLMIRGGRDTEEIRKTIEISLARVGIQYDDIKEQIVTKINKEEI